MWDSRADLAIWASRSRIFGTLGQVAGYGFAKSAFRRAHDLERVGPVVAFQLVKRRNPAATLTWLWAMAAGLKGINLLELSEAEKDRLRHQLSELDAEQ